MPLSIRPTSPSTDQQAGPSVQMILVLRRTEEEISSWTLERLCVVLCCGMMIQMMQEMRWRKKKSDSLNDNIDKSQTHVILEAKFSLDMVRDKGLERKKCQKKSKIE